MHRAKDRTPELQPHPDLEQFTGTPSPVPTRPHQIDRGLWQVMIARYRAAVLAYVTFLEQCYRPVVRAIEQECDPDIPEVRSALNDKYGLTEVEETGNDLLVDQLEQVRTLVGTPAPDWAAVALKLEILHKDVFSDDEDHAELIAELVADARQLKRINLDK